MATTAIDLLAPLHRLSVADYLRMAEVGLFEADGRVELIDGVVVEVNAEGRPHLKAVAWLLRALLPQVSAEHMVLPQSTLWMPEQRSAPEPDVWVTDAGQLDTDDPLPLLVIEVSETSLRYDRTTKAALYARRGVAEYWIVGLADQVVEVRRRPTGPDWGELTVHEAGENLRPLQLPGVSVDLAALFAFAGR